jgi:uncharacterized protein YjbJ (UPF0337 family)
MDKDRVKGAVDQVVGSAKRHIGDLTGDSRTEAEGAVQQVKGKVESAWGKTKDAARDVRANLEAAHEPNQEAKRKNREAGVAEDRNPI